EGTARLDEGVRSLGREHVAVSIDCHSFTGHTLIRAILTLEGRDEPNYAILVHRPDTHPVVPVRMVQWTRLRVDYVEGVAPDEEAARAAEHVARIEIVPVLIEDFQSVVAAIGHPQAAPRVEGERMRRAELTVMEADL